MNRITLLALTLVAFVSSTVLSSAQIILPPSLANAANGTQFRLIFSTYGTTNAESSDINYYNDFVTTEANQDAALAALGTTWTAVASTGSESVYLNTNTNPSSGGVPIYNLNGQEVAANNAGLWSGSLLHAIIYSQYGGGNQHNAEVWTGLTGGGSDLLVLGNSNDQVLFGNDFQTSSAWTDSYVFAPGTELGLYGISGVLTVKDGIVVAPEPTTWAYLLLGFAGLGAGRFLRARQKHVRS